MSQLLRLLHRSGSARLLLLITLLALTGGTLLTLASLRPHDSEPIDRAAYDRLMSTRVQSLDELLQWFYDQQAQWERIIPPGLDLLLQPGLPDVVVLAPDGKDWPDALRKAFERLKPTWRNSVPTYELDLQEDLKGQITIRDSVGNTLFTVPAPPDYQMPYEALFRQSVSPLLYEPWLNRYKLRARITLLPEAFVEPYLYAQAEIEAFARQQTEPEMQMMMSGGACSEITFTAIELSTNGMDFALCVPEGITNADLFASTNLMPDGFPWVWVATNLQVVTNRVVWSWANLGETNVFFAAGDGATDSDGDGLPDAREFFLYGTGMNAWDSDGDSYSDGEEVQWGTNPLDNQSMPALGRGVVINEVLYDPAGSDAGKEWVELFNTNRVSVDLSGYILQLGSNVFGDVYTFPAGTVLPSGDFLLVGGNLVANADQVVELTMLNRGSTGPTAGVRLLTPSATSNRVVDALLYAPNNTYNLPTTAFGTNGFAPYANSGQALARIKVGYDTDHASDWRYTSSPTPTAQGAAPDLDGDGLSNAAEIVGAMTGYGYRTTDYNLADTDGDTFLDGEERTNSPPTDPRLYDTDGDAFPWAITHGSDGAEVHYAGTDPTNPDSDGDGLPDGWEAALGLDPFDSDSDQNGTSDSDEDTDGDGASNGEEMGQNSNPVDGDSSQPHHFRMVLHQLPQPGWASGEDMGTATEAIYRFDNVTQTTKVYLIIADGGGVEESFHVTWQHAVAPGETGGRTNLVWATLLPGTVPKVIITDGETTWPNENPDERGADLSVELAEVTLTGPCYLGVDATGLFGPAGQTNDITFNANLKPTRLSNIVFTLVSPAGCQFDDGASVRTTNAANGAASVKVREQNNASSDLDTETITASAMYDISTNFTAVRVDVQMMGLSEEQEEDPGIMLCAVTSNVEALTLDVTPDVLRTSDYIRLSFAAPLEVFTTAAMTTPVTTNDLLAWVDTTLYVRSTNSVAQAMITASHNQSTAKDRVMVTLLEVEFKRDGTCSGFDDTLTPPWIMVPKTGNNTAIAEIDPAAVANQVGFVSADTSKATVSPTTASASPQTVTVSGVAKGDTEIQAKPSGSSVACATLKVTVRNRIDKTVVIHAITEENDDVQVIPVGQGQPNQTCITAGTNGVLNTTAAGDDTISGDTITAGPNGICNTTASGDDVQVIVVGHGKANATCVGKGANSFRDSTPSGDDAVSGDDISTGVDGICNTSASSANLVPVNVPSASTLQSYLNDSTWGKQANVHFTVTRSDAAVNYDLDRDGELADPWAYSTTWVEIDVITATAKVSTVDYNVYFVKNYEYPVALSDPSRGEAWVGDLHQGSTEYVTAHEIGHLLGRVGHAGATSSVDLMGATDSSASPCRLIKIDWDFVNP